MAENILELKILADSNLKAIETIERLLPKKKIRCLKVDNGYIFTGEKVYTIQVHHDEKIEKNKVL